MDYKVNMPRISAPGLPAMFGSRFAALVISLLLSSFVAADQLRDDCRAI